MAGIGSSGAPGVQFATGDASHDNILTDFYLPRVADARNNSAVLFAMLPKTSNRISGKFVVFPVLTTRNLDGTNTIKPGGSLPDPASQGSDTYTFMPRHQYARIKIDGPTMAAAQTNGGAFLDVLDIEMNGIVDDIVIETNRMLHNDGSGRIAEITAINTDTLTLKVNDGIEAAANAGTDVLQHFIQDGQRVMACTDIDGSHRTTTFDSSYDKATATVDIASGDGSNVSVGDWLTRVSTDTAAPGNSTNSGYRSEPMGIGGIIADGQVADGNGLASGQTGTDGNIGATGVGFQGITSVGNEFNQAVIIDNGGTSRPISERLMQTMVSDFEEENNGDVSLLMSSYGTYNSYVDLLIPDKRFNTTELHGGHKALDFNGIGWIKDRFCYGRRVYGLNMPMFNVYEMEPLHFLDFHGQKWDRLEDVDAYQCAMVARWTTGVDVRQRAGCLLADLDE